jgi:hypothetical protein
MKTKLILTFLALLTITALASGQNNGVSSRAQNGKGNCRAYVDANDNGICDHYENRMSDNSDAKRSENFRCYGQNHRYGHNHKGLCQGDGHGRAFVDANNNGVCDRNENPAKK